LPHFIDVNFLRATKILDFRHASDLLALFKGLDREAMSAEARQAYDKAVTYFHNHVQRMDYPSYLQNGWQIATGAVESACKVVINQRLNMGGMRWGESGSDAVCHLRALFYSDTDQWDGYWSYSKAA
jgi:hypothetical protein